MESYSGKTLEKYLESKNDWLLKKLEKEINFKNKSRDKKTAYYWFEIQPDTFDISLGDVSFHNSSVGYRFIHGTEIFPYEDVFLKSPDFEIFLKWFSKCFITAGGKQLQQMYLISYRNSNDYYSLQLSRWLTKEELIEISVRKKSTVLTHQSTGLQFTFPVHYLNRYGEDLDIVSNDNRYVYFHYEEASFEIKVEFCSEDSSGKALSKNSFHEKKKAELEIWKNYLLEDGLKYLHESDNEMASGCPSLRITCKDPRSGEIQVHICFFARDPEDDETVYRIYIECKNVHNKHEAIIENMVNRIGEKKRTRKKKWWKW